MSKHTPEPWKISHDDSTEEWSVITNNSGSIVANVNGRTGPELVGSAPVMRKMPGLENARRIVACVNACSGIRTEALEHRAHMLKAHDDTIAELKRQLDRLQSEAINCHEMLCSEIERTTNLIAELGFVSEYATKSVIGFCKGDEKSIFEFSKFMEGIFNRYDIELSSECEGLINEGKFTKRENSLN